MTHQPQANYRISRRRCWQEQAAVMANPRDRLTGASVWLLPVCLLLSLLCGASEGRAAPTVRRTFDTLDELAQVLNVVRAPPNHHAPPDYFRHLYHSTTDADGFPRGPAPHRADTIYGYLSAVPQPVPNVHNFFYNVTQLDSGTQLLSSDLHVFRMRRWRRTRVKRVAPRRSSPFLLLKLYKVLDRARRRTPYGNKLIDMKRVTSHHHGWIVFNAQQAVMDWVQHGQATNFGFLITAQTSDGRFVDPATMQFAQRFQHHDRLQPLLAVYTNHSRRHASEDTPYSTALTQAFDRNDPQRFAKIYGGYFYVPPPRVRQRRDSEAALRDADSQRNPSRWRRGRNSRKRRVTTNQGFCGKRSMYVNFTTLGWDAWVVSPKGYNAYSCQGECPYPLSQTSDPTNHAIVLSLVFNSKTHRNLEGPCCVPKKLQSLTLLYYDTKFRVVLRPFHGMSVVSCGCQ